MNLEIIKLENDPKLGHKSRSISEFTIIVKSLVKYDSINIY
jgi:hypothetical protein